MAIVRFPREDESLKNQTELSPIDDATYHSLYAYKQPSVLDRIIQVVLFIVFFGWLRVIILFVSVLIFLVLLSPIAILCYHDYLGGLVLPTEIFICQIFIRIVGFCVGVYHIKVTGEPDPDTRCFVYNHVSLMDGPLLFYLRKFSPVIAVGAKEAPFFGRVLIGARSIFIDRSKSSGNSSVLTDAIKNSNIPPLALAPEAKISNGNALFKFRTGAFLSGEQVQPMTIRYTMYLAYGGVTINALCPSLLEWFWLGFCVPAGKLEVTYLPPMRRVEGDTRTPEQRAEIAELMMANHLGTLAAARTSHEIVKHKED
jgi:1-acyl-sn-glycerol-3-phosphate acyltransferase